MQNSTENRVICGKCNTSFDLSQNDGCPLCGFGSAHYKQTNTHIDSVSRENTSLQNKNEITKIQTINYLAIPQDRNVIPGMVSTDQETQAVGNWGMTNSFFPGKAVLRILANKLNEEGLEYITLDALVKTTSDVVESNGFSKLRGFPNKPRETNSLNRLVYHFIRPFAKMGFFAVKLKDEKKDDVWDAQWSNIEITITKEGLEFAKLKNRIFDDKDTTQVLTAEEKQWLVNYLRKIDKQDYCEFSMLKDIFEFLKAGNNGNEDLWNWFSNNESFKNYVMTWSRKAGDEKAFKEQIENLAKTFASGKIALLRELGVVNNKRNNYDILGNLW